MMSDLRGFRCRLTTFDDHSLCKYEIHVVCIHAQISSFSNFRGDSLYKMIEGYFLRINQSNRYFRIRFRLITFNF